MPKKPKVHLICNAHLDPVWQWQWQDGAAETLSTFRTAAELCEKNPSFIFNHNESLLYEWVNEYEPALFKRIQKLVKQGRWNIMGGWYVQPDCNLPSGESFVRQILLGKQFFKKHFNRDITTAINFDPFGHTQGLVQILAKSGFDSYLFGRPLHGNTLPDGPFIWKGRDGSEVMALRFPGWYNTPFGQAAEVTEKRIDETLKKSDLFLMLWGVGNHGGGPSKIDVKNINALIRQRKDCEILHSTPQAYFKEISRQKSTLPTVDKDINPWAVGCYTSMIRIKQKHRKLENELYSTEKMVSTAAYQGLMTYPAEQLKQTAKDLSFLEFHDILPGSCIQPAEEDALELAGKALEHLSQLKMKAFFALANGQPKAKDGEIPVLVYNPHPFKVKQSVMCEFNLADMSWDIHRVVDVYKNNRLLPCQVENEDCNLDVDWRKRISFTAVLEPGMNRFVCKTRQVKKMPAIKAKPKNNKITFRSKELHVEINTRTGLIDKYRVNGTNCVQPKAFEPIVLADTADSWEEPSLRFSKRAGKFKLMSKQEGTRFSGVPTGTIDSVRIIEDGPVRMIVEAVFKYNDSRLVQRYILPKSGTEMEVDIRVYWNEKDTMLKLSVPTALKDSTYTGQAAYAVESLPTNGDEAVAQKWVAAVSKKNNLAVSCINDGIYGSDFVKNRFRLTLLRSPAYCSNRYSHGKRGLRGDRFSPRMDQGERRFRLWFNGGPATQRLNAIDREALVRNEQVYTLSFFAPGQGKKPKPLALLNDSAVQIAAVKKAETNNDLIIRLYEPTGKKRQTILTLPIFKKKIKVALNGFEIKTLRIHPKTGKFTEVDLLERPVK